LLIQILPWLYIGSCSSGSYQDSLQQLGVKTVINVHSHVDPEYDGIKQLQIYLRDGPGNDWKTIMEVLEAVDIGRRSGRVLVHCCGGLSRSPFIALSYLVVKEGMDTDTALYLVSKRHPYLSIHPSLLDLLRQNTARGDGSTMPSP